jgi:voltage-gated potassium channel
VDKLLRAGADHVVSPYDVSGRHMGVLALHPAIVDFLDMAKLAPGLRLEEIEVRDGSPLAGKGVGETRARYPDAQLLARKPSGDTHITVPDHDTVLGAGDLVLVLGPEQTLKTMAG